MVFGLLKGNTEAYWCGSARIDSFMVVHTILNGRVWGQAGKKVKGGRAKFRHSDEGGKLNLFFTRYIPNNSSLTDSGSKNKETWRPLLTKLSFSHWALSGRDHQKPVGRSGYKSGQRGWTQQKNTTRAWAHFFFALLWQNLPEIGQKPVRQGKPCPRRFRIDPLEPDPGHRFVGGNGSVQKDVQKVWGTRQFGMRVLGAGGTSPKKNNTKGPFCNCAAGPPKKTFTLNKLNGGRIVSSTK